MNDNKFFDMTAKVFNGVAGTDRIIVDDICFYRNRISDKDFVTQNIVDWINEKQLNITNKNESKKAEIVTCIGSAIAKSAYVGIEKEGYRLYDSSNAMTFHIENESHFVKSAEEAVDIIADIAMAAADRYYDREQWLKDFCRDEIAEKNQLKHELKNGTEAGHDVLVQEYKSALNALNQKRLIGKEHPHYKAMLIETAKENISTYFINNRDSYMISPERGTMNSVGNSPESISGDKFVPRQVWVAEDTPHQLYQYQNDGHDLYMTEEPVKGFAMIAPDFFEAPDEVIRIPMDYIRQEVRIKEGCDPLLMPEIEEHVKNGGRLFSMGNVRDNVMFVVAGDPSDEVTNMTPAQYMLVDELEFVNIEMAEQEFAAAMADISVGDETEMMV